MSCCISLSTNIGEVKIPHYNYLSSFRSSYLLQECLIHLFLIWWSAVLSLHNITNVLFPLYLHLGTLKKFLLLSSWTCEE